MLDGLRRFFISADLYKSITFVLAALVPVLLFYYVFGNVEIGFALAFGVFYNAPTNSSGSFKHRTLAMSISIVLTSFATLIIGYFSNYKFLVLPILGVLTFLYSYISVYGFRASLVALAGLIALVLGFAHSFETLAVFEYTLYVFLGGIWYLLFTSFANYLNPKMYIEELLADTVQLTGDYLQIRSALLKGKSDREQLHKRLFELQADLTEKHETLRDVLLSNRQKSGVSNRIRRKLLLFIEILDVYEFAVANPVNYKKVDKLFNTQPFYIDNFVVLIEEMSSHLHYIAKVIIRDEKVKVNSVLSKQMLAIKKSIQNYQRVMEVDADRDGLYILENLLEYQASQVKKIRAIERVLNILVSNNSLKSKTQTDHRFLTPQDYGWNKFVVNFSFRSTIFRHSLRLALVMMLGYLLGDIFAFQNSYWILLTLVVIMRPSYGLTKERMKHRVLGTLIGACIALVVVYFVAAKTTYAVLAAVTLVLALALVQINYRTFATFITLHVVFVYALYNDSVLEAIQFRLIDTVIGGSLAVLSNLFLFPSWEFMTVQESIVETLQKNINYIQKIDDDYQNNTAKGIDYKLARKESFLAMGELNAAFQRMNQEPKSKQKYYAEIYEIVVLSNTFLSTTTSLATFIHKHHFSQISLDFSAFIECIEVNLLSAKNIILEVNTRQIYTSSKIKQAKAAFDNQFKTLSEILTGQDATTIPGKKYAKNSLEMRQTQMIFEQLIYLLTLSENLVQKTMLYKQKTTT